MALDTVAVLSRLRELVEEITGMKRVYAQSVEGMNGIPAAINDFPAALVFKGPTREYILRKGQHRHTYEVAIQVLAAGGDSSHAPAAVLPMIDRLLEKLADNVALSGIANISITERDSGMSTLTYAGKDYVGHDIRLRVSEQAEADPKYGAALTP